MELFDHPPVMHMGCATSQHACTIETERNVVEDEKDDFDEELSFIQVIKCPI
jgi:hypothetical protein